tara:strand:- start:597 stop:935 length:339 start_codon:yes stop_codon:yes gene_type:complete
MDTFDYQEYIRKNPLLEDLNEDTNEASDLENLRMLLSEVSTICERNISKAHNIDLEDISQTIDSILDNLNSIESFETFDDEGLDTEYTPPTDDSPSPGSTWTGGNNEFWEKK